MTTDEQADTFQLVLVDIKKAAEGDIQCVKQPLSQDYVAISYRCGELAERTIDTQVGYVASITSFDLEDFYKLCYTMTKEPTMSHIPYVWVDAICVDPSSKKATIHHRIYEHATWILAVPDLHTGYLETMAFHKQIRAVIQTHRVYLYHLLHCNIEQPTEHQRTLEIRRAMAVLTDLVVDWSSRVWVISEILISKKKNNLKFWFIQLDRSDAVMTFFDHDIYLKKIQNSQANPNLLFYDFYQRLIKQLNEQSFLEMMLKSKASKNEDRFYSLFPLFPYYKDINHDEVKNITSMVSVKLKLYQVMNDHDKARLLDLSADGDMTYTLPTFATSVIRWGTDRSHVKTIDITLYKTRDLYYLKLMPRTSYLIARGVVCKEAARVMTQLGSHALMDAVIVGHIQLIGNVHENTWLLANSIPADYEPSDIPKDFAGFHVF